MEEKIALYMKNLGISRKEALELIADDDADVSVELTAEQAKVAKEMAQADRKKETTPRKRERKPDEMKRSLILDFDTLLIALRCDPVITNPVRDIEFDFMGDHYRLTLSKPRKN